MTTSRTATPAPTHRGWPTTTAAQHAGDIGHVLSDLAIVGRSRDEARHRLAIAVARTVGIRTLRNTRDSASIPASQRAEDCVVLRGYGVGLRGTRLQECWFFFEHLVIVDDESFDLLATGPTDDQGWIFVWRVATRRVTDPWDDHASLGALSRQRPTRSWGKRRR